MQHQWNDKILSVKEGHFESLALEIFRYQYGLNAIYRQFVDTLGIKVEAVKTLSAIPFLPIGFFKSHRVTTGDFKEEVFFESSGTTAEVHSRHFVKDASLYKGSFLKAFDRFYGDIGDWCIIGLLPSYLERGNSSLVYMVDTLIQLSSQPASGFYLSDFEKLHQTLVVQESDAIKTLVIGVTFALLDFAEKYSFPLRHTTIMETGGMKGRKREMVRAEVHERLKKAFFLDAIHSEYGMTELLSQAYSASGGVFYCPPWMKILIREEEDPLSILNTDYKRNTSVTGAVNIIDLANVHSCSFIATDDAGRLYEDGSFEILGRLDNSDIRGCSLMVV